MLMRLIKVIPVLVFIFLASLLFNNLYEKRQHNHALALKEQKIIGSVTRPNPRVKEIQKILHDLKLYHGPVNGKIQEKTRAAIRHFQKASGLAETGRMDRGTFTDLIRLELQNGAKKANKVKYASNQGTGAQDTKGEILKEDSAAKSKDEIQSEILQSRVEIKKRIRHIQSALKKAGFYQGNMDGKMGPLTRKAVEDFQKANNLKPDGLVGAGTWKELNKLPAFGN